MVDLATTYLGLALKNPLVVSASPLSGKIDTIYELEAAGAAAIVLPSLFEEQIKIENKRLSRYVPYASSPLPEELSHIPNMTAYNWGINGYIVHLYEAKKAVDIPIIASLNAYQGGGWAGLARILEGAGADALELNIYHLATDPSLSSGDVERMYLELVRDVKASVTKIPVAIKLSPYFSALVNMGQQLEAAGADGLVLFNRFYQPDFDVETTTVVPSLDLSSSAELRLRLRWVALLAGQITADLAITGGVHTAEDVVKGLLAGAQVTMMTSALLRHGVGHLTTVLADLQAWLAAHHYASVAELRGKLSQQVDDDSLVRANYMEVLRSHSE